jgi:hypothetical protein
VRFLAVMGLLRCSSYGTWSSLAIKSVVDRVSSRSRNSLCTWLFKRSRSALALPLSLASELTAVVGVDVRFGDLDNLSFQGASAIFYCT